MATVSSFEGLRQPRASDLRQFRELFEPLFSASTDEARRQAAAALARCPNVPPSVALQIGGAPIAIAALFLTRAVAIDDAVLVQLIRSRSPAHANAIARRERLSVRVVDALVERRDSAPPVASAGPAEPVPRRSDRQREDSLRREEALRQELKALARAAVPAGSRSPQVLAPLDATHEALLSRFARAGEVNLFAATLAHALDCSAAFGERLVLDVSGWQLAAGLCALGAARADMTTILLALYPYLGERIGGGTRCDALLDGIDPTDIRRRVEGWIAADGGRRESGHRHMAQNAPERADDPRETTAGRQPPQVVSTFYRRTVVRGAR